MMETVPAPAPERSCSTITKLSRAVSSHATLSLTIIIVLLILVVSMYVYYHGIYSFGPYSTKANFVADAETERLINTINAN